MKLLLIVVSLLISVKSWAEPPALNCDLGPANKIYGGTPWLVYGCNDQHSVVVVTAPNSPAVPFYFMFAYSNGSYRLQGEGTGDKTKTDAAYADLRKFTNIQIARLFSEASNTLKK